MFYLKKQQKQTIQYVRECPTCQQCKTENMANLGLLRALLVATTLFIDISMDFITSLPQSEVIFKVMDRFICTLYVAFTPLDMKARELARMF
jgi:hypothetical protein